MEAKPIYEDAAVRDDRPRAPRLNEPAPDFEAVTTQGIKRLADFRGRWLLLFSHPADFTPVCTSEFVAFAEAYDGFQALNCDILGLSIDGLAAHMAWIRNIEEKFGVTIPFPVIADLTMDVARTYGMIHPGASTTSTVRSVFLIDPEGIVRVMMYYPINVGRSISEVLRLLAALQASDRFRVVTPASWQPGEKVLLPPPTTLKDIPERLEEENCTDWFYCEKAV